MMRVGDQKGKKIGAQRSRGWYLHIIDSGHLMFCTCVNNPHFQLSKVGNWVNS